MKKGLRALVAASAVTGLIVGAVTGSSAAPRNNPLKGEGKNMKIVANVGYPGGTDMEFATIKGHDYAFAGSASGVGGAKAGALHVINIDNPAKPRVAATLNCSLYQADIQISYDQKTVIMGADSAGGPDGCLALGQAGFMTVDIRNPMKPKPIGFAAIPAGSHNTTAHPTKPYVYNSDSELAKRGEIQIWSIKDPSKPKLVNTIPSLPHSPHDISFNKDGSLMVTAAISHFDIYDTSDPENPTLLYEGQCPGCSITHDAKFTPDGKHIVIGDEGGGGGAYPCPGGALYFYDFSTPPVPVLTGVYEPDELVLAKDDQGGPEGCTAHVFDFNDKGNLVSISWYSAGTRLLDISSMIGPSFGGNTAAGVQELGWFEPDGGVSWSSKIYTNDKYIFSNDENRGFDVFQYTGK
ncbi:MAG TPA: hypothetical protein VFK89_08200 [Actinomycetota bacterium]|nr:hypothetical protein [Actinomycetota bacterium]